MLPTRRLLATLTTASGASPARYLTPGNPTGLTGLLTHPSPRSTLVYLYTTTLSALSSLPPTSAYRASCEALTAHRLDIVSSTKPAAHAAWAEQAAKLVAENPRELGKLAEGAPKEVLGEFVEARMLREAEKKVINGKKLRTEEDREWDGEEERVELEGPRGEEERRDIGRFAEKEPIHEFVEWVESPALEARQVSEIEEKIGAGLIEEVIEVAKGERELVSRMAEAKVWEELKEKPAQGQWTYFERETN